VGQETIGARIKRFREERGMTATELAARAKVAKSYLSALENETREAPRPSAQTLYRIGQALGVAISDLLGRSIAVRPENDWPKSLVDFARRRGLPEADIEMLASIQFRGERPKTADRWEFIYQAIRNSAGMDKR
jgi:transcriptional regulator with XRE-family HTH domain